VLSQQCAVLSFIGRKTVKILSAYKLKAMVAATLITCAGPAAAQDAVNWNMASIVPSNFALMGVGGARIAEQIKKVTGGNISIEYFEPGALVPAFQIFDAVSSGAVDAGWSGSGYWQGKIPAAAFFNSIPFGPGPLEFVAWIKNGGGQEIWDDLYAEHNLKALPCLVSPPEGSLWVKEEIDSPDDLAGMKLRYFGLGALVMEKLGASTQVVPAGETYAALERGVVDGLEQSMPMFDLELGFWQIAKHYYMPGWHQQASILELLMNLEKWNALTDEQRELITIACDENIAWSAHRGDIMQSEALIELEEKGVNIHVWSDEDIALFNEKWEEVVAEQSANDPDFKRAWESLSAFREKYAKWVDSGYLK
jgi:TRAP-type mannitol/chloroaromatic compound transport system substrate-binding protein